MNSGPSGLQALQSEKALLLPLAAVNRAHQLVSSNRDEENLTAFLMAQAESLFVARAAHGHLRTPKRPADLVTRRRGPRAQTAPLSGEDSWGVLSDLRGQEPRQAPAAQATAFRSPKAVRAAGRPPAGDSFRVVACGSGVRWESGPVDDSHWLPLVVRSRGDGGRAQGSVDPRPRACAHPAPPKILKVFRTRPGSIKCCL